MNTLLFILITATALLDWYAVYKKEKSIEYFVKPAFIVLLILFVILNTHSLNSSAWLLAGLAFSLAGDIFLMLRKEAFAMGLLSFLLAHIFYIVTFIKLPNTLAYNAVILAIISILGLVAIFVDYRIFTKIKTTSNKKMIIPIFIYSAILFLMVCVAYGVAADNLVGVNQNLIALGATLFLFSDLTLAWNKFVSPIKKGKVITIVLYHFAQFCITLGVLLLQNL